MNDQAQAPQSKSVALLTSLSETLGFNPTQEPRPNSDVFSEVLSELKEERAKLSKERAKALLTKAMVEAQEFDKVRKAFQKAETEHVKNFEKTVKTIKALANGQPEPVEEEKEESK